MIEHSPLVKHHVKMCPNIIAHSRPSEVVVFCDGVLAEQTGLRAIGPKCGKPKTKGHMQQRYRNGSHPSLPNRYPTAAVLDRVVRNRSSRAGPTTVQHLDP